LQQYQDYLPTILKLLLPSCKEHSPDTSSEDLQEHSTWANQHPFLNVSVTPIEASLICSRHLAETYFAPKIAQKKASSVKGTSHASISAENYVVISVEGAGMEAGQRVLELTGPLALAGM